MKPATAWPPVPLTYSTEKVLKRGEGEEREGGGMEGNQWLHQKGVTYEVTQNGFWTVGEEDEKVAFVSLPCFFGDSSHIWTEMIRWDCEIIINS